jgi:hypothetical protein
MVKSYAPLERPGTEGTHLKAKYVISAFGLVCLAITVCAASAQWVAFDSAFPQHFVDTQSIIRVRRDVMRFWDRAGAFPSGNGPDSKYPQYTLREMNCKTHMSRTLRWDLALEAGKDATAQQARAKFMVDTAQLQQHYPSEWESLDPSPHDYALLEFVCRPRN